MRVSANLGFLFQEVPLIERYAKAAKAGFTWIEVPLPYSETADSLRKIADQYGLKHSLINAPTGDWVGGQRGLAAIMKKEEFNQTIVQAIEYCRTLDCRRLHVMAGRGKEASQERYFENIALACKLCQKHDIQVFVEPICTAAIDDYFLNSFEQVEQMMDRRIKVALLLDFFHAQQICGSLTKTVKRFGSLIQYVQVAQMLKESGLADCFVGCEYAPSARDNFSWIQKFGLHF